VAGFRYVISYDLTDDKRRRKVALFLESLGYRVQYSVFECAMTDAGLRRALSSLRPQITGNDSLRAYRLCENCILGARVLGSARDPWSQTLVL
jgi:CRISPR-associated protein Cas2